MPLTRVRGELTWNGDEHLHRRQLKVGDQPAQLLRQSGRLDHDVEEEGTHKDRHNHCRLAMIILICILPDIVMILLRIFG